MHFFADDIILVGQSREEINEQLEVRGYVLETHDFCPSRSKTEYMNASLARNAQIIA